MTETMTQRGVGLLAPTSRQDIVSQLLSAYANSFGQGDPSPSRLSPVPVDKELPPPPPRSDSLVRKPLPAFERAEERMSAKFPLRSKLNCIRVVGIQVECCTLRTNCQLLRHLAQVLVHFITALHFTLLSPRCQRLRHVSVLSLYTFAATAVAHRRAFASYPTAAC